MSLNPPPSPRTPPVNRSAVVAATAVAFALVVCVLAWIVTHPHKAAAHAAPEPVVVALTPPVDPAPPPPSPAPQPATRPALVIEAIPAVHRPERREGVVNESALIEEEPPPLPAPLPAPAPKADPVQEPAAAAKAPPAAPAGETYGTEVLFLNNPDAAAELARRDKKLLFIMHISGNFEDSCFT